MLLFQSIQCCTGARQPQKMTASTEVMVGLVNNHHNRTDTRTAELYLLTWSIQSATLKHKLFLLINTGNKLLASHTLALTSTDSRVLGYTSYWKIKKIYHTKKGKRRGRREVIQEIITKIPSPVSDKLLTCFRRKKGRRITTQTFKGSICKCMCPDLNLCFACACVNRWPKEQTT